MFVIMLMAFTGSILAGILGWLSSQEPFEWRKFGTTVIRGVISGALVGWGFSDASATARDAIGALLTGAGVDVLGKRGQDALTTMVDSSGRKPPAPPHIPPAGAQS